MKVNCKKTQMCRRDDGLLVWVCDVYRRRMLYKYQAIKVSGSCGREKSKTKVVKGQSQIDLKMLRQRSYSYLYIICNMFFLQLLLLLPNISSFIYLTSAFTSLGCVSFFLHCIYLLFSSAFLSSSPFIPHPHCFHNIHMVGFFGSFWSLFLVSFLNCFFAFSTSLLILHSFTFLL